MLCLLILIIQIFLLIHFLGLLHLLTFNVFFLVYKVTTYVNSDLYLLWRHALRHLGKVQTMLARKTLIAYLADLLPRLCHVGVLEAQLVDRHLLEVVFLQELPLAAVVVDIPEQHLVVFLRPLVVHLRVRVSHNHVPVLRLALVLGAPLHLSRDDHPIYSIILRMLVYHLAELMLLLLCPRLISASGLHGV